jgi:acyl carrier protein
VYEARRLRPLLADVGPVAAAHAPRRAAGPPALLASLAGVDADQRRRLVVQFLQEQVAAAIGASGPSAVDIEQGLFDMGMDSLMSVELRGRIERALDVELPSTLTFNYPSVRTLADHLVDDVLAETPHSPAADPPAPVAATTPAPTDDMSEDELADLLAARLAGLQ